MTVLVIEEVKLFVEFEKIGCSILYILLTIVNKIKRSILFVKTRLRYWTSVYDSVKNWVAPRNNGTGLRFGVCD